MSVSDLILVHLCCLLELQDFPARRGSISCNVFLLKKHSSCCLPSWKCSANRPGHKGLKEYASAQKTLMPLSQNLLIPRHLPLFNKGPSTKELQELCREVLNGATLRPFQRDQRVTRFKHIALFWEDLLSATLVVVMWFSQCPLNYLNLFCVVSYDLNSWDLLKKRKKMCSAEGRKWNTH